MRTDVLERKFNQMGASVEFKDKRARDAHRRRLNFYNSGRGGSKPTLPERPTIDVATRGKDEIFILDKLGSKGEIQVLDVKADARHLLLMFKQDAEIAKFLCGHDERHWFVAAVPESAGAKNVEDAMNALKPEEVVESQKRSKVKKKNRHKRKNDGYIRQGEWFFVPADIEINELEIHYNEPISRGRGGRPHICQELVRIGGTEVYVNSQLAPSGITKKAFDKLIKDDRENRWKGGGWRRMTRDAVAYVRGFVKHPDHKTIHLPGWHKVIMNLENKAKAMEMVVFLD